MAVWESARITDWTLSLVNPECFYNRRYRFNKIILGKRGKNVADWPSASSAADGAKTIPFTQHNVRLFTKEWQKKISMHHILPTWFCPPHTPHTFFGVTRLKEVEWSEENYGMGGNEELDWRVFPSSFHPFCPTKCFFPQVMDGQSRMAWGHWFASASSNE
jgi:hypothetical protein